MPSADKLVNRIFSDSVVDLIRDPWIYLHHNFMILLIITYRNETLINVTTARTLFCTSLVAIIVLVVFCQILWQKIRRAAENKHEINKTI